MQWCLLSIIIPLALFAASSECLLIGTTNLAFTSRSHRCSNSVVGFSLLQASSSNELSDYYLTPGKPISYFIVEKYDVPSELFEEADIKRLNMTTGNVTLPSALVML